VNSSAPKHGMWICLAVMEGPDLSHHPSRPIALLGWLEGRFHAFHWEADAQHYVLHLLYFFAIIISSNWCQEIAAALIIHFFWSTIVKYTLRYSFHSFPFFHDLSILRCSLILGFFHDTLMAPAAQQLLSQCNLSLAFLSISPTHLSGLWVHDGTIRAAPAPGQLR